MKKYLLIFLLSRIVVADSHFYGPTPYGSFSDSPFNGISFQKFYLENFESGALSTPGVIATNNNPGGSQLGVFGPEAGYTDSVDGDDGIIDGSGLNGHSFGAANAGGDNYGHTYVFDAAVLGGFPTHVGIVWTDGSMTAPTLFEAFDTSGNSLGTIGPVKISDNSWSGTTDDEDRFFGVSNTNGISKIVLRDPDGNNTLEVDHLQYGIQNINIGGSVTNTGLQNVVCKNVTTGQTLTIKRLKGATIWDCTATGLQTNKGDIIRETLTGVVK